MDGITATVYSRTLVTLSRGHSFFEFVPEFQVVRQSEIAWQGHSPFQLGQQVEATVELVGWKVGRDSCRLQFRALSEQENSDILDVDFILLKEEVKHSAVRKDLFPIGECHLCKVDLKQERQRCGGDARPFDAAPPIRQPPTAGASISLGNCGTRRIDGSARRTTVSTMSIGTWVSRPNARMTCSTRLSIIGTSGSVVPQHQINHPATADVRGSRFKAQRRRLYSS